MRILYDGDIYTLQPAGGITRYFESLISRLPADFEVSILVGDSINSQYPPHPNRKILEYNGFHQTPAQHHLGRYYSSFRNRLRRATLARKSFDVCHPTYYTRVSREGYRCPVVITVWDMIHELFSAELDPNGGFAEQKRKAIEAAQKVICISENTRTDLLERYSIPESKVVVTHLASELDRSLADGSEVVPSRPYFLYVGKRDGYKNFDGLLEAFAKLVSQRPGLALCIVGGPLDDSENKRLAGLGLSDHIEYYGYPSDNHLAKLYRCSVALVYPSLYEGFGLPPLEAMACGSVAVVCRTSSIPEVVGDAGVYFDPKSPNELTDIMDSLSRDETMRESLVLKGREQAKKFTWERTVAQTVDAYRAAGG